MIREPSCPSVVQRVWRDLYSGALAAMSIAVAVACSANPNDSDGPQSTAGASGSTSRGGAAGSVGTTTGSAGRGGVAGGASGSGGGGASSGSGGAGGSARGGASGSGGSAAGSSGSGGQNPRDASADSSGSSGAGGARDGGSDVDAGRGDSTGPFDASKNDAIAEGGTTCTPPAPGSQGKNPLFTDQFTADPGVLVHDCTFYIQCGHDEAAVGQNGFVMKEWFLLSSKDMINWTKTVAMKIGDFAWADANAWAGQMVKKDGKFYWYVPVNQKGSGMAIGVAVADSPTGPFKDAIGKALVDDAFEMANFGYSQASQTVFTIDPTVFVDDDGQAYLHYGGFSRMVVAKLGADMVTVSGKMQEVTPQGFFEAPFLFKRGGKYYEVYAAGTNPATIDYATATNPMGPFTRMGRILDALPGVAGQDAPTNHAGVAEFAGQWYFVYHLSNGPNGGGTYRREVAIEKMTFNADGTIQKIATSGGLTF